MGACSICQHPARAEVVEALTAASLRQVAQQYHVSKSALIRHRQRCGPPQVDQVDHAPPPRGNPWAAYHAEVLQLQQALREARYTDNWIHMARAITDVLARMTGDATIASR